MNALVTNADDPLCSRCGRRRSEHFGSPEGAVGKGSGWADPDILLSPTEPLVANAAGVVADADPDGPLPLPEPVVVANGWLQELGVSAGTVDDDELPISPVVPR